MRLRQLLHHTTRQRRSLVLGIAAAMLTGVTATAVTTTTGDAAGSAAPGGSFVAEADAYVDVGKGFDNFGTSEELALDIGKRVFLRFTVTGLSDDVSDARLRLHVADSSSAGSDKGGRLRGVSDTSWSETMIRYWWLQPQIDGPELDQLGPVEPGTWQELDVSSVVDGNGTYSFALTSDSFDNVVYDSRETGAATAPQLVVDDGGTTTTTSSTSTSTTSTSTTSTSTTSTTSTTTVPSEDDPILVGAGDIALCPGGQQGATADAISGIIADNPDSEVTVFAAGDNAYQLGTISEYNNCYDPSWGVFKDQTRPAPGNHEYFSGAGGYFDYFGQSAGERDRGYYSYDIDENWHVISLNGNCSSIGGCDSGSNQYQWLVDDLQNTTRPCAVAYFHQAYFTSSSFHPQDGAPMLPLIRQLYDAGVEIVVQGHEHQYESFEPQTPDRAPDPATGIEAFVVGTGGTTSFYGMGPAQPNSRTRITDTNGVLKLTLASSGYDFEFVTAPGGEVADEGSGTCH